VDVAEVTRRLQALLDGGTVKKAAVAAVAEALGVPKREVYALAVGLTPSG
jgi:hypothetical protein